MDTRLALMRAAEQLLAQLGVDRVSLREIAIAAGQRNVSAATYHFGSKRELIEAILERHSKPIHDHWRSVLENDPEQKLTLRELAELLVVPIFAKADDPDGGRCYLELCAELVTSRSFPLIGMRVATAPAAAELARRVAQLGSDVPPLLRMLRAMRLIALIYTSIADYLRITANGIVIARDTFLADLVSTIVALVRADAPQSEPAHTFT